MSELRGRACPAWTTAEDRIIRDLNGHEGAEGWSQELRERIYEVLADE